MHTNAPLIGKLFLGSDREIYILHSFAVLCQSFIHQQLFLSACSQTIFISSSTEMKSRMLCFCCLTWLSLDDNNYFLCTKTMMLEECFTGTSSPGICQNPDPCRCITAKTQQENPQRNKDHVVRRTNDIFKSATQYNNKCKLCGNHEQKPDFSCYGEPVGINAIFEMSNDTK